MNLKLIIFIVLWTAIVSANDSKYRCMLRDYVRLGNSCYYISSEIASWQEAHFRCRDRGSQLAVLASHYEDSTLRSYLERPEFAQLGRWIGGMWARKWMWAAQGSEIENDTSFVSEAAANPGDTDQWLCMFMDPQNGFLWNTENCMSKYHYICEAPLAREVGGSPDDASPSSDITSTAAPVTISAESFTVFTQTHATEDVANSPDQDFDNHGSDGYSDENSEIFTVSQGQN